MSSERAIFPFALSDHQSDKLGFSGGASNYLMLLCPLRKNIVGMKVF